MLPPQKILTNWLKKLFSDSHAAIVGVVLGSIFVSGTGIYIFAKNLWLQLIAAMQLSIPLWATIALVLLSGLYIFLRTSKSRSLSPRKKDISETAMKILIFLGERGELALPVTFFYEKFDLSYNQAQYAIEELLQFNLLETYKEKDSLDKYYLSFSGRKFLSNENLL